MPTTGGNVGMKNSQPSADAFTVARMRKAGALILAKANMSEFARGGMSLSSLGGQVLNPYDLTRTPGGSSGGTGAAVAANLALIGTGSDTGQSIRSPASANNLVGVRPTRGLVSRSGVIPNSQTQDEVGPIARTVTDAALLLDVMAGYDAGDPITAFGAGRIPKSYTHLLRKDALKGARIGVMTNLFGDGGPPSRGQPRDGRRHLPGWSRWAPLSSASTCRSTTRSRRRSRRRHSKPARSWTGISRRSVPTRRSSSLAQLVAAKTSAVQKTLEEELAVVDGMNSQTYKDRMLNRDKLRLAVATKIADLKLDAILYPLQKILAVPITADDQAERNGTLSNGTGFPAVTFQAGFSAPSASAPLGVPVGAELLGLDYTEDRLLAYAYAFEQAVAIRKPPASTPALPHEP